MYLCKTPEILRFRNAVSFHITHKKARQDRQSTYKRHTEALSCSHRYSGKAISNTYSEYVSLALVIQHAMCMRHILICCLSGSTIFPTFPHQRHCFIKNVTEYKMCVWFSLQLLSETFLILRRNERDMIKNVHISSFEVPVILVRF